MLKVHSFSRGYNTEKVEKLCEGAAKAKYLVLDLRSNGGGATTNLIHLLSLLLPVETKVGVFVSRRTMQEYEKENPEAPKDVLSIANWAPRKYTTSKRKIEPFKGKIAVLINRGSASASEICAAALRECAGSPLIGGKSAGAVLASTYARLALDWEIQYPVNDYVTIKGMRLEGNPLQPGSGCARRPGLQRGHCSRKGSRNPSNRHRQVVQTQKALPPAIWRRERFSLQAESYFRTVMVTGSDLVPSELMPVTVIVYSVFEPPTGVPRSIDSVSSSPRKLAS